MASQCMERQQRQGKAWQDKARKGKARQGMARHGKESLGKKGCNVLNSPLKRHLVLLYESDLIKALK
jgi:hypothetical protein